jgi:surfeit locus 1 family protein
VNARFRLAVVTICTSLAVALTLSLGFWQLRRAAQKEVMARDIQVALAKPSLSATDVSVERVIDQWLHYAVHLTGEWLPQHTVYLDNRQMQGKVGFFVLTPFRIDGTKEIVMVQRGWAPRNFVDRTALPDVQTPSGPVSLTGRIAMPPSKLYEFDGASQGPIRQNLNMFAFKQEVGLSIRTDFSVLQLGQPSEGLMRDWPQIQFGVDKHYGYAVQWFAISALMAGLYAWFFLRPLLPVLKKD